MPTHPYAFPVAIQKRSGGGPFGANTQLNLLCTDADPNNPDNNAYLSVINASTFPSIVVAGKKSPSFGLHTCLKPRDGSDGWSNAALLNSLIHTDADNNTDYFAAAFADEVETRIYDYARCERMDFAGHAQGGPQSVMMGFINRWGDQDGPYNTTLPDGEVVGAAPTFAMTGQTPDAGQATPSAFVLFVGLDTVMSYQMSLLRGQSARYYFGNGPGPANIPSTMFAGLLTVEQEADASTQITDTGTVTIEYNTDKTSTTGRFRIIMLLKRDNRFKPQRTRIGTVTTTFSCFDEVSGGNCAVIEAF